MDKLITRMVSGLVKYRDKKILRKAAAILRRDDVNDVYFATILTRDELVKLVEMRGE